MTSFDRLSLIEIAADVGAGRRSAVEVARDALARAAEYEAVQPAVWITRVAETDVLAQAREQVQTAEAQLVAERGGLERDLAWWHPLVSGDPETVHASGASVRGRAIDERRAGLLEHHIVDWPGQMPRTRKKKGAGR